MVRRILTVASGKGGVGKTTFAINFALALSRVAPTILVDLDTGTSSIRSTLDLEVKKDLYHYFRRGAALEDCITVLDRHMDPEGLYGDFGVIAAPRHTIEEISSMGEAARWRLMAALNELPASFIILDLRAGLDGHVLDFLPLSNSGILIFTPHHPAATLAAANIVRSLLFRKLRFVFAKESPLFAGHGGFQQYRLVNELLDQVEDVYVEELQNLDAFLVDLEHSLGNNPYLRPIREVIHGFGVYFVLNMFNGIEESWEAAVRPFVEHLHGHVSRRLTITNLGWIVQDPAVHRANCQGHPIILDAPRQPARRAGNPVLEELERLEASLLGLPTRDDFTPGEAAAHDAFAGLDGPDPFTAQLEVLNRMYSSRGATRVRDNFAYITHRALHLARDLPAEVFGQPRLMPPSAMLRHIFQPRGSKD